MLEEDSEDKSVEEFRPLKPRGLTLDDLIKKDEVLRS